ncbi:hypothetical protein ACPF04_06205 [Campylobacter sp. MOP51]|uniref:hypothetical protein n=1 Tax=Campylobacter canis TaxID=3378588 RepID=UPI003C4E4EE1
MKMLLKEELIGVWQELDTYLKKMGIEVLDKLSPIAIVESTLYIRYTGNLDELIHFRYIYSKHREVIEATIKEKFGVAEILNDKDINQVKLNWLKNLIDTYQPTGIKFFLG